jgi:hypothetical protein
LIDFQRKVAQIPEAIGFAFNDFDFVVNPFDLTGVDGIITVIDNTVTVALKHVGKSS